MVLGIAELTNTSIIADYLDENAVVFFDPDETRDQCLEHLSNILHEQGKVKDKKAFFQAILQREQIVSTGIGMGVAIPHAKMPDYENFFIAVGIQSYQGIDWQSLDELPVHLVFMIGGPANQQSEYLMILSALTKIIRNPKLRAELTHITNPHQIIKCITEEEKKLLENA